MGYAEINKALNEALLSGRYESRPVYLVLNKVARQQVAYSLSCDPDEVDEYCCGEVSKYLKRTGDPYQQFNGLLPRWNKSRPDPNKEFPFTALLFLLSHAAELMVSDGEFRATNYYQRLAKITGVPVGHLSQYGRSTERFWLALNKWLTDNDLRYGRPTAQQVNANRYVGIAMSQAILREADRQRLHDMFQKYGFTGTDTITEGEIAQYLSSWMSTTRPTSQLKAAWAKAELRSRICEIAVAEISEWASQAGNGAAAAGGSRMSIAASFRRDLLARSLSLWIGKEANVEPAPFTVAGPTAARVELANSSFGNFATLEPRSAIDLGQAMLTGLSLVGTDGSTLAWNPRAVIPLRRSEKGNYWTEVSRVTLGIEHLVLVRDDKAIRAAVDRILGQAAAPGYSMHGPTSLKGVPTGWLLYEAVQVLQVVPGCDGFEAALVPVGMSSGLQLSGGLRLGQGIWHSWKPPAAFCDARSPAVRIEARQGTSRDGDLIAVSLSVDGETSLHLEKEALPADGVVYLEALDGDETIGSTSLLLRSAARPRPLDRQSRGQLGYVGNQRVVEIAGLERPVARGGSSPDTADERASEVDVSAFGKSGIVTEEAADEAPLELSYASSSRAGVPVTSMPLEEQMKLPCAVRGFHHYQVEYVPPGYPKTAPVSMECRGCSVSLLKRRGPISEPATRRPGPSPARLQPAATRAAVPVPDTDLDLWLDAFGFLGEGPASALEVLGASMDIEAWRAVAWLRDFSWLGHLDVALAKDHRPAHWCVAPPALVFVAPERAFLAGFRNEQLLGDVGRVASEIDGSISRQSLPGQPALVEVDGFPLEIAEAVLGDVIDPHGRKLAIGKNAAFNLAAFSRASGSPYADFTAISVGKPEALQRFDAPTGRWKAATSLDGPAAFRFAYAGTVYCFVDERGRCFSGPHELVKTAAARLQGTRLHAYDPASRTFFSRLGCEPPGLLGRALVLSSGRLPTREAGCSKFANVALPVASLVLECLYLGNLPS